MFKYSRHINSETYFNSLYKPTFLEIRNAIVTYVN